MRNFVKSSGPDVTSRATLHLVSQSIRQRAVKWTMIAPEGTCVTFRKARRSDPQSRKMHAMLSDIARQHCWHERRLTKDQWKLIFLDALAGELDTVPSLDGTGFVAIGRSSSDLTVAEMSDMIELMYRWGADAAHPVRWTEPDPLAARIAEPAPCRGFAKDPLK
jgi:hypothetical protein